MTLLTISKQSGIKYINNVRWYNYCNGELTIVCGYKQTNNYVVMKEYYTMVKEIQNDKK